MFPLSVSWFLLCKKSLQGNFCFIPSNESNSVILDAIQSEGAEKKQENEDAQREIETKRKVLNLENLDNIILYLENFDTKMKLK